MSMGLGDKGATGIQEFVSQHHCNNICRQLGLPKLQTLTETPCESAQIVMNHVVTVALFSVHFFSDQRNGQCYSWHWVD
jgi:hypothetical protein